MHIIPQVQLQSEMATTDKCELTIYCRWSFGSRQNIAQDLLKILLET